MEHWQQSINKRQLKIKIKKIKKKVVSKKSVQSLMEKLQEKLQEKLKKVAKNVCIGHKKLKAALKAAPPMILFGAPIILFGVNRIERCRFDP